MNLLITQKNIKMKAKAHDKHYWRELIGSWKKAMNTRMIFVPG